MELCIIQAKIGDAYNDLFIHRERQSVTHQSEEAYITKDEYGVEHEYLNEEVGVPIYQHPNYVLRLIDATDDELHEKLANFFEEKAHAIARAITNI